MYISQKMSIFIIMGVMEHINIRSCQIGVEKKENCKFTTLQVLNLLMLFPFFIVKNASRYSNSYCPFSRLPLACYEDRAAFKIFVLDVGLLGAMSNLKAATIVSVSSYVSSSNPRLSLTVWFLSQIHSVVSGVPTTMASFTSYYLSSYSFFLVIPL